MSVPHGGGFHDVQFPPDEPQGSLIGKRDVPPRLAGLHPVVATDQPAPPRRKADARAPPPKESATIDELRREGNDIVIEFEAKPDKSYEVRSGTDLTSFPTLVQTIAATPTDGIRIVTDPGAASLPKRFYRAVLLP